MDDGLADDPTVDLDLPFELSGREDPLSHGLLQERIFSFSVEIAVTLRAGPQAFISAVGLP